VAGRIWQVPKNFRGKLPNLPNPRGPANPKPKFDAKKLAKPQKIFTIKGSMQRCVVQIIKKFVAEIRNFTQK
jgi:hypothetical protein